VKPNLNLTLVQRKGNLNLFIVGSKERLVTEEQEIQFLTGGV
jgi:hypothetical protein